MKAIGLKLTA